MLKMFVTVNILLSIMFMMISHPLSMGLVLLLQTIIISLITGNNFWFSYIIILVMVGGMLILFMYMTSIASNEKFKFNLKLITPMMILILTLIPISFFQLNTNNNEMMELKSEMTISTSLNKFINFPSNMLLLFTMTFLFLILISTVNIANINKGPLRQKN
uniref:NADH-ubiquinone oxidoreductase chain 6 n=1 Tax=Prostomis sp. PRO01 TaxID=1205644 RepID=A0A0S2MQ64_9CUCU|nr:NADH deshydrogenase subunit 6 [Prostomis sp. PRO01]